MSLKSITVKVKTVKSKNGYDETITEISYTTSKKEEQIKVSEALELLAEGIIMITKNAK